MIKYTKQQLQKRKMWQMIGLAVVIGAVLTALFVTIAAETNNEPAVDNRIEQEN